MDGCIIFVCFSHPFFVARETLSSMEKWLKNKFGKEEYINMITSTSNQQIKKIIQLAKKGKVRREEDVFLVEGLRMYQEAPQEKIVKTYVSESFWKKEQKRFQDKEIEIVEDRIFQSASDTITPQGILSIVRQYHYQMEEFWKKENPFFLVLENIQDPGNMGTIFRTAEGAGVDGIFLSKDCVDIYNPKVIRSTMGSIYRMPFLYTDCVTDLVTQLQNKKVRVFAAHLKGEKNYDQENYLSGTAFLIGNEGNGLTEELAQKADCYIKIPMAGKVESLNAAVAASILMYEVSRQRRGRREI